jgi:hypothetical protein
MGFSHINNTMTTKLYVLCEPSGEIRYIGKTAYRLEKRLYWHLREAKSHRDNSYRCNWIRSVLAKGCLPNACLIGEVEGDGCKEEIAWIAYGKQEGWRLVNRAIGGDGSVGYRFTEEQRKRLSKAITGHKHSEETKRKMSASQMGHPSRTLGKTWRLSSEIILKFSKAQKGRVITPEHRKHISEACKGRKVWNKGLKHSDESIRKMAESHKKENLSAETLKKMSEAHRGRVPWNKGRIGFFHHSEETRKRFSEFRKGKLLGKHSKKEKKHELN